MNDNNIKIDKVNILIPLISALLWVIFHNLNISWYIKDVIFPFSLILIGNIIILKNNEYINKKAYYFLIPISLILLSGMILEIDYNNMFLNIIILPILFMMFFFTLTNKNYKITFSNLSLVFKIFPKDLFYNLKTLESGAKNGDIKKITNIILGIIIGGILALVILSLLISADDYFGIFIRNLSRFLPINTSNIALLVIYFSVLFSISLNIIKNKTLKIKKVIYKKHESTMIITILSIINLVFVLFLVSELSRLTNNFLQIPMEYTYSSYAREGFFQLLFITVINFSVITYLLYKTECVKQSKVVKSLIYLLIGFSIILIMNSYYRMFLYIGHYGFTILRLQVILFLAMELSIFAVILKKLIKGLIHNDAMIYLVIMTFFYIINLYICNTVFINLLSK